MTDETLSPDEQLAMLPDDLDAIAETDESDAPAEYQADADEDGATQDEPGAGDEEEDDGEPDTALDAPQFLDEKEREAFLALPREAQQMLLKHDRALVTAFTRKTQALAAERRSVEMQRNRLDQILETFQDVIPDAEREAREWQNVDWVAAAQSMTPDAYNQARAQAEAAQARVIELHRKRQAAEQANLDVYVDEQMQRLRQIAPQTAPEFLREDAPEKVWAPLMEYIRNYGYTEDQIRWMGASDALIAWKALQYDRLRNKQKPALTPKPDAKSTARPIRSGAAAAASSSQRKGRADVYQQFLKTGSPKLAEQLLRDID